jgi:hypothetical protein
MICSCGCIMLKRVHFWECPTKPFGEPGGCGRVEFFKENPNGKS